MSALEGGNPDEEDVAQKATRLAARAARFNKSAPGQRNKDLENARAQERKAFEARGLINSGKTELTDAVEMRGTCESMCSPFEIETRNIRMEVHPFEKGPDSKLDPNKAVAAYTRSDAGAGHGDSAILPSDLRTPQALVRSLDYLFSKIMPTPPTAASSKSIDRKALGHTAGFIRDRTRAIRKEFAMQSSWGQAESIESHERIARWHILCLRELQEETGFNSDMHIDSAELGRCLTSLRQFYNDERERTGQETPCPNEPEMIAYMLIFDLANKSVSIPISELPGAILDQPIVKLAWEIRKTAQRNFDTQKGGSLHNSELGSNFISRYIRLLKQPDVPFLLSCMVEVRLREVRRSALRAMTRTYPRLKTDPIRYNDEGQIAERKMVLIESLDRILGCEEQDQEETAWQDVVPSSRKEDDEAVNVVSNFDLEVWPEKRNPVGSLINLGSPFDDNQDAPFTKRWKLITEKRRDMSLVHIVNGETGVLMGSESGVSAKPRSRPAIMPKANNGPAPSFSFTKPSAFTAPQSTQQPVAAPVAAPAAPKPVANASAFNFSFGNPPAPTPVPAQPTIKPATATKPADAPNQPATLPSNLFGKKVVTFAPTPEPSPSPSPALAATPAVASPQPAVPSFSFKPTPPSTTAESKLASMPSFFGPPRTAEPSKSPEPVAAAPSFSFKTPTATPPTQPLASTPKAPEPIAPITKPARKSPTLTDTQRRAQRKALPALRDRLIAEMVADKLSGIEPELASIVKQSRAARAYAEAKARRQEAVALYAQKAFDTLLEQVIEEAATQAYLAQIVRNGRLRAIVRRWKDWAIMQRQDREAAIREREKAFERLGSMGLTFSSLGISDDPMSLSSTLRSTDSASRISNSPIGGQRPSSRTHAHEKIDPFAADVMLHQTERSKDHFYSTATFLATTARFVAPLLQPVSPISSTFAFESALTSRREMYFRTLLSPSRDSATPSSDTAFEWLRLKIFPATDDCYTQDGITFDAEVMGRYDDISQSASLGLLVFEAPLQTWSSEKTRSNAADAQDRIMQLHELANKQSNEYSPALLILTWEEETLDEASERLGLKDALQSFDQVGSLSLESAEDLDERFAEVLEPLLAESPLRQQVIIDLRDAANRLWPSWERLLTTIRLAIPSSGQNIGYVSQALKLGIEALNESIKAVRSALGATEICETSTFDPPTLPPFTYEVQGGSGDISSLAEVVAEYLQDDFFADYSDVSLYIAPLRQAAFHSRTLPIDGILQSLGVMMFSEIATERLPIRAFYPTESGVEEYKLNYLDSLHSGYEKKVDTSVSALASIQSQSQSQLHSADQDDTTTKTLTYGTSPSKSKTSLSTSTSSPKESRTLKRSHSRASLSTPNDENRSPRSPRRVAPASEIKALKNAKLLKALREVEKTLGSMEVEEQQRLNEVF